MVCFIQENGRKWTTGNLFRRGDEGGDLKG